jgi:hypothetical protein
MSEELQNRVLSHDKQLVKIETILERVAQNQDEINKTLSGLSIAFTKLTSIEGNNKTSFDRVHARIDSEIKARDEKLEVRDDKIKILEGRLDELDVFSFLSKYPKITVFVCILLYATAISDIRHAVLGTPTVTKEIPGKTAVFK